MVARAPTTRASLLGELDLAVGAHIHRLIEDEVKLTRFALTAPEVLRRLEKCGMKEDLKTAKPVTAVLSSLQRLLAFKNPIEGVGTVASAIATTLSNLETTVSSEHRRQVRKAAQASAVAHDDAHLVALEQRMSVISRSRAGSVKSVGTRSAPFTVHR